MKKIIALLMVLILSASMLLTGCGKNTSTTPNETTTGEETTADTAVTVTPVADTAVADTAWKWFKYETPIELTFSAPIDASTKWRDGETVDNNPFITWAKDTLGINWSTKFTSPNEAEQANKMNIMMASDDLPDSIYADVAQMSVLKDGGYLYEDIDGLIEQYGSPLLKDCIRQAQEASNNNFYTAFSKNGKAYALPNALDTWGMSWYSTFIREDILAELGKPVPVTLDQLDDVLAAYKAKYPDNYPVSLDKDILAGNASKISPAMQPYGAYPQRWLKADDGTLVYGSVQPEVRAGLEKLANWYKAGYIAPDFITMDFGKATEAIGAGNTLTVTGDWWYVFWPFPNTTTAVPTAKFVSTSLQGPDGVAMTIGQNPFSKAVGISKNCKHPEAFIYQLNEYVDSCLRNRTDLRERMKAEFNYDFKYSPETVESSTQTDPAAEDGLKEYNRIMVGPGYLETDLHSKYYPGFWFNGAVEPSYNNSYKQVEADKSGDLSKLEASLVPGIQSFKDMKTWDTVVSEIELTGKMKGNIYQDNFLGAPTATMVEKGAYLQKIELETFTKIIIGAAPISDFDKFVEDWKKAGGDDVTKEVNEWNTNK